MNYGDDTDIFAYVDAAEKSHREVITILSERKVPFTTIPASRGTPTVVRGISEYRGLEQIREFAKTYAESYAIQGK